MAVAFWAVLLCSTSGPTGIEYLGPLSIIHVIFPFHLQQVVNLRRSLFSLLTPVDRKIFLLNVASISFIILASNRLDWGSNCVTSFTELLVSRRTSISRIHCISYFSVSILWCGYVKCDSRSNHYIKRALIVYWLCVTMITILGPNGLLSH